MSRALYKYYTNLSLDRGMAPSCVYDVAACPRDTGTYKHLSSGRHSVCH